MKFTIFFAFFISVTSSAINAANFDETQIQIPLKDSNEERLYPTICRTISDRPWNICTSMHSETLEVPKEFRFINTGENKIVPQSGTLIGRGFTFKFQDLARSDLGLLVWDIPDEDTRHGHLKLMMFFPRDILPAIQDDPQKHIMTVTLPTREQVIFNSDSKEIIGGVLSEGPIDQDSAGQAVNPLVTYTGLGVVIEANRINEYPAGINGSSALIRKKGYKNCQVQVRELWYTDKNKGGNVYFNKNFITDQGLDQFLKTRCKFSMYP
jgi:hypothetical protein